MKTNILYSNRKRRLTQLNRNILQELEKKHNHKQDVNMTSTTTDANESDVENLNIKYRNLTEQKKYLNLELIDITNESNKFENEREEIIREMIDNNGLISQTTEEMYQRGMMFVTWFPVFLFIPFAGIFCEVRKWK